MSVKMRVNLSGLGALSARLHTLVDRLENPRQLWEEVSRYMASATQHRIYRSKTAPDGSKWEKLSALTIRLKGNDTILYRTGKLGQSIKVRHLTDKGFTLHADAPYATHMQFGVPRTGGKFPGRRVPARPFMGFSEENIRRIATMVNNHIRK